MTRRTLPFLASLCLISCIGPQKPAPVTHYGTSAGAGSSGVHTVSSGETLYSISKRYAVIMQDVVISNNLHAPFMLSAGQRLKLPPPREYKVRPGDTLYEISRLFGVSSTDVARLNYLQSPYIVQAGEVLKLPSASGGAQVEMASAKAAPKPGQKPAQTVSLPKSQRAAQAKSTARTPKRSSSKFLKPVKGRVISNYGPKKNGLHNDGMNIRAPKGTSVRSAENGVVVYAGSELKGSGNLVLVRHEDRWMTAYGHLDKIAIKRGDVIKRGQSIGTVGATGSVDSPQLHFEVRRGTEAINPKLYIEG